MTFPEIDLVIECVLLAITGCNGEPAGANMFFDDTRLHGLESGMPINVGCDTDEILTVACLYPLDKCVEEVPSKHLLQRPLEHWVCPTCKIDGVRPCITMYDNLVVGGVATGFTDVEHFYKTMCRSYNVLHVAPFGDVQL